MTVRIVSSDEQFHGLRSAWQALLETNSNHTPYQSWEWNYTWWKHFGVDGELRLLVIEEDGQLIGIAPLRLARFRGTPLRYLTFISRKHADYLDFVVSAGQEAVFFRQLFEHLDTTPAGWSFLELRDMRNTSTNMPYVLQAAAKALPALGWDAGEICVAAALAPTWDAFLTSVSKRTRKDIGYDRRNFEKNFAADFRIFTASPGVLAGLQDVAKVYRSRWQEEKGATHFDDDETARFEREICQLFAEAGWLRLYVLYANNEPVAALSGVERNNKYYAQTFAHSPAFHKYSVGNVLLGRAVEDCIGNGRTELDLTRGGESYKFRWNGQVRRNFHIRAFRNRRTLALVALLDGLIEGADAIKPLKSVRAWFKRRRASSVDAAAASGQQGVSVS